VLDLDWISLFSTSYLYRYGLFVCIGTALGRITDYGPTAQPFLDALFNAPSGAGRTCFKSFGGKLYLASPLTGLRARAQGARGYERGRGHGCGWAEPRGGGRNCFNLYNFFLLT
jgi:hypothetical protein